MAGCKGNDFIKGQADEGALVAALLSLAGLVRDLRTGTDEDADVDVLLCGLEALQQAGQADGDAGGDALRLLDDAAIPISLLEELLYLEPRPDGDMPDALAGAGPCRG